MLVLFASFIEGPHNTNVFSRCKSSLIVVCNEEHVDKHMGSNQDCSFAYKIPVHGMNKVFLKVSLNKKKYTYQWKFFTYLIMINDK
jgi:hypothetical protein